jgi:hypothetical protein
MPLWLTLRELIDGDNCSRERTIIHSQRVSYMLYISRLEAMMRGGRKRSG